MGNDAIGDDLKRSLEQLRRELSQDLARIRVLRPIAEISEDLAQLELDLSAQLERVRTAAVITLVGATGAGKSTLLNALVGRAIAREGDSRPTTRAAVLYRPVDADVSRLLSSLPGEAPQIVDYDPDLGGPWREQILIDAPDINSIAEEHREIVRLLASRSDVLVIVAHRQSVSELASVSFVDAFAGRRGMIFVLNRADELTDSARKELLAKISELARTRWRADDARVIATSARAARFQTAVPGWEELCASLHEFVQAGILGRVRRHNALGTAVAIAECVREKVPDLLRELNELENQTELSFQNWRNAIEHLVAERVALRAVHVRELLWTEAARRWDGPGGLALRAGGLSSLGLGAGALLVRRNPLLAAGAAAGALVADRTREFLRERAIADAGALLPSEVELDVLYREHFAGVRLAVARLSGSSEGLGTVTRDALGTHALAATTASWNELVERDLAQVASSGVTLPVRMIFDVPVYAFGGWLVYRAARGMFSDEALGIDLLIDAGILLFAWLFLARTIVRAYLGLRVSGLVESLRRRIATSLELATGAEQESLQSQLSDLSNSLQRLQTLEVRWRKRIEG